MGMSGFGPFLGLFLGMSQSSIQTHANLIRKTNTLAQGIIELDPNILTCIPHNENQ